MIQLSIIVLSYLAGVLSPFVYFAFDWQRDKYKARHFFGEET